MQLFGEVDPFFEELTNEWEIYDTNVVPHIIAFNGSPTKPLLTTGWDTLRSFFKWNGIYQLSFFYFGQNKFFMVTAKYPTNITTSILPSFHSMSTLIDNNRKFLMTIRAADLISPTVVSFSTIFSHPIYLYVNLSFYITYQQLIC
jgi:hypothetical protein